MSGPLAEGRMHSHTSSMLQFVLALLVAGPALSQDTEPFFYGATVPPLAPVQVILSPPMQFQLPAIESEVVSPVAFAPPSPTSEHFVQGQSVQEQSLVKQQALLQEQSLVTEQSLVKEQAVQEQSLVQEQLLVQAEASATVEKPIEAPVFQPVVVKEASVIKTVVKPALRSVVKVALLPVVKKVYGPPAVKVAPLPVVKQVYGPPAVKVASLPVVKQAYGPPAVRVAPLPVVKVAYSPPVFKTVVKPIYEFPSLRPVVKVAPAMKPTHEAPALRPVVKAEAPVMEGKHVFSLVELLTAGSRLAPRPEYGVF